MWRPLDSDWGGEDPSQDQEDMLCNTLLITGPTGVGKTAAVYACAQELGFKVSSATAVFPDMHPLVALLHHWISSTSAGSPESV